MPNTLSKSKTQVVIAGAGPVGSVAAISLAQRGIDVILLEAGPDCAQDLRASTFHPPTLEMLDEIDVTSALINEGPESTGIPVSRSQRGRNLRL